MTRQLELLFGIPRPATGPTYPAVLWEFTMRVLINPRTKCAHDPDCRWLAGTSIKLASLDEDDLVRSPEGYRPCSQCTPNVASAPNRSGRHNWVLATSSRT